MKQVAGSIKRNWPSIVKWPPSRSSLTSTRPRKLLARGERLTELLKQPQYAPLKVEEQVVVIFAGVSGYLDKIAVKDINRFEQSYLDDIRANGADILESIRVSKALGEETKGKLAAFLAGFVKTFA